MTDDVAGCGGGGLVVVVARKCRWGNEKYIVFFFIWVVQHANSIIISLDSLDNMLRPVWTWDTETQSHM